MSFWVDCGNCNEHLEVKISDSLFKQIKEVAAKEKVSVDYIVSIALAAGFRFPSA